MSGFLFPASFVYIGSPDRSRFVINYSRLIRYGIFCLAVLGLALAGCGRNGPLEPPPNAPGSQAQSLPSLSPFSTDVDQTAPQKTAANPNPSSKNQSFL